ncbi:MAG: helix-turn-helix transcriptional regulator [Archangium sp.]|nr:helix-turn-helix transcriptional regulator [Archangium sp.]
MATRHRRSACPISIALELLGDQWSLLVVRDLMFKGKHTFGEFLAGGEGIASNVLTDRLARLELAGVVTREPHPDDARKVRYLLTEKGLSLAPVLMELVVWSARWERTAAPPDEVKAMREQREAVLERVKRDWKRARTRGR